KWGFMFRTALPARSAAKRQSFAVAPHPQQAPPLVELCGSLRRSIPMTVVLFRYRLVSVTQSLIHALSGNALVYQSPLASAELPASERWLSRITRSPIDPAKATILSRICNEVRPCRSVLIGLPLFVLIFVGTGLDSTIWLENGIRTTLYPLFLIVVRMAL